MSSAAEHLLVARYYLILEQLSAVLGAYLILKFGHIYLMFVVSRWVSEEDEMPPAKRRPAEPPHPARTLLWTGIGALLLVCSLLQIPPFLVTSTAEAVYRTALGGMGQPAWILRLLEETSVAWTGNALWLNIFAVLTQAGLGMVLLLSRERIAGKIALALTLLLGLFVWAVWEGFGGLFAMASPMLGNPGPGLWVAISAALLLLPKRSWYSGQVSGFLRTLLSAYWLYAALAQILSGTGFARGLAATAARSWLPQGSHWVAAILGLSSIAAAQPVLVNALFAAIPAALSGLTWFHGASRWTLILTGVWLFFNWWLGQGFGLSPSVGLNLGAAPFLILLAAASFLMERRAPRRFAASSALQN